MAIYQLGDKKPVIPASCYIAEEAVIIGDVRLGEGVSIWPGAVLRDVIASGAVRVAINQRFALKDAAQAHDALTSKKTTGATILLP